MNGDHSGKGSPKRFEPTLYFGGIEQGWHIAAQHFSIIGETGSGKTLTLRMLLKSVLKRAGQGVRVVLFDPKCQFMPLVAGMAPGIPIDIAHIGDVRTVGWDMHARLPDLQGLPQHRARLDAGQSE